MKLSVPGSAVVRPPQFTLRDGMVLILPRVSSRKPLTLPFLGPLARALATPASKPNPTTTPPRSSPSKIKMDPLLEPPARRHLMTIFDSPGRYFLERNVKKVEATAAAALIATFVTVITDLVPLDILSVSLKYLTVSAAPALGMFALIDWACLGSGILLATIRAISKPFARKAYH